MSMNIFRRRQFNKLFSLTAFNISKLSTTNNERTTKTTHFGFEIVSEDEKNKKVYEVFEQVAESYDVMNDVMSLGIHRLWKDIFVEKLGPHHGIKLLDVAGGTGDIPFRALKYLLNNDQKNEYQRSSEVTVCDINQAMLDVGKRRSDRLNINKSLDINWVCGDAEKLPFKDNSFTAYTIAFGIRNVTHIDLVLQEAFRVLVPGGRFMCLEFSHLNNEVMQWLYDRYSFQIIPPMGQILTGKWEPYQYLVESIRKFPDQETFKQMIETAGFKHVSNENLTFGVCSIHSGFKF